MKGLCVRGELETEQTATYWPQVPLTTAALLSHFAGLLNRGSLRAASPLSGAASHCLELQRELQLQLNPTLKPSVAPGYIIVWHPPASCGRRICTEFNPSTGQGDIFDQMHLFLDWRLGRRSICYKCFRLEQRSVMKSLVDKKCKPWEIYRRLWDVYGKVCFRGILLTNGQSNVQDEDRPDRPTIACTPEEVYSVYAFILPDGKVAT